MNSRPDRNVRPTFFNDPDASGGTDISVCAFFNRLLEGEVRIFRICSISGCSASGCSTLPGEHLRSVRRSLCQDTRDPVPVGHLLHA